MSDLVQTLRRELALIEAGVAKLEAEAAKLQARLRSTLDKGEKLKALLSLYADEALEPNQQGLFEPSSTAPTPRSAPTTNFESKRTSKAARIRAEVIDLLSARGTEHRQKILDHLVSKGLMGHEATPIAALAAYLSTNKEFFVADGKGNFSLRRDARQETPPAPASAGSAEESAPATPATH